MDMNNLKRNDIEIRIKNIIKKVNADLNLKGSWENSCFHLNEECYFSFSDIDIVTSNETIDTIYLQSKIRSLVNKQTNLDLDVSIHKKHSLYRMSLEQSRRLAILEYFYKQQNVKSKQEMEYIKSKFLLLLLRDKTNETYLEVFNRLNNRFVSLLLDVKLGLTSFIDQNVFDKIGQLYFENTTDSKFNFSCIMTEKSNIYAIKNQSEIVLNHSNFEEYLETKILTKLKSVGI